MTAAQIRAAAQIVESAHLNDDFVVTFMEMGSEGCLFRLGTWKERGPRILIARDGTWIGETDANA